MSCGRKPRIADGSRSRAYKPRSSLRLQRSKASRCSPLTGHTPPGKGHARCCSTAWRSLSKRRLAARSHGHENKNGAEANLEIWVKRCRQQQFSQFSNLAPDPHSRLDFFKSEIVRSSIVIRFPLPPQALASRMNRSSAASCCTRERSSSCTWRVNCSSWTSCSVSVRMYCW